MSKPYRQNMLELVPQRVIEHFSTDENGIVTLEVENKGVFNRIAQMLFKKPKITYIHLDETGSFVWPLIDGKTSIEDIGRVVSSHLGEKCEPLYPRLAKFFQILESYNFIKFKELMLTN